MGPNLLLLLLLIPAGQSSVYSLPEVLQASLGGSIVVQCHYRLQDSKARKVWCRFMPEGCQPVVSSAVDRRVSGGRHPFLTDLGGGLLQVEMVNLEEEDAGEYGCVVEGASGPQTVHRVILEILPTGEFSSSYTLGALGKEASSDLVGSASPPEPSQDEKSIPLIWGAVVLLGLLVVAVAVVLFAAMAKRKGNRLAASCPFQNSTAPGMDPSSVAHCIGDPGQAVDSPSSVPYVRLDSPPSFDNTTYASISGKPPLPSPSSSLPPKALICSSPVTYATVIFPGGDKGGGASCGPVQNPPN
ncbi:PREDICTED: trem-like transcript 1 protein [Chrysochloris asiatica]|uniref:Trem-like transcript 1 protein n=1 Tax=Chrysochloris asiatica TaxID=185453 RepID=A0A9B0T8V9_CHRAS|nr:PREDICTED: trem-like transcript 1 protein [Chrysochloris asiatica]